MKTCCALFVFAAILLVDCSSPKADVTIMEKDYEFLSIAWGDDWDTVQKSDALRHAEAEAVRDNGRMTDVMAKGLDFYGYSVDAWLSFGNRDFSDKGLSQVVIQYQDGDEENLLADMIEVYGEPQNYFLDKNGIENPIHPCGWCTEEDVETSLTERAKEKYLEMAKDIEPSRLDALLRQPLVTITFHDEQNQITFNGRDAAVVRELNNQTR